MLPCELECVYQQNNDEPGELPAGQGVAVVGYCYILCDFWAMRRADCRLVPGKQTQA